MDLFEFRNEYLKGGLSRDMLDDNPFAQFKQWFDHAVECKVIEPNAMVVSTVSETGAPSSRIVLLKSWDENGFVKKSTIRYYGLDKLDNIGQRQAVSSEG